jgi:nodulation protein F
MDTLDTEIITIIAKAARVPEESVTMETELAKLDIFSIELAEIIFDLEDAHGIEIDMNTAEAWANLKTVADITAAVRQLIADKG